MSEYVIYRTTHWWVVLELKVDYYTKVQDFATRNGAEDYIRSQEEN